MSGVVMPTPPKNTIDHTWIGLLEKIVTTGESITPNGRSTLEILGNSIIIDMNCPVVTVAARRLGYKFMAAEAYWILTGDNRVETIAPFSKHIVKFSDDEKTFFGAYGPWFVAQLDYIVDTLLVSPYSRQAVMTMWQQSPKPSKDIPCTVALQFLIRDGALQVIATMRSSDAWLGVPYDLFNFSSIAMHVVLKLRAKGVTYALGDLLLQTGSQHLYDDDLPQVRIVLVNQVPLFLTHKTPITPELFSDVEHHLDWLESLRFTGLLRFYEEQPAVCEDPPDA